MPPAKNPLIKRKAAQKKQAVQKKKVDRVAKMTPKQLEKHLKEERERNNRKLTTAAARKEEAERLRKQYLEKQANWQAARKAQEEAKRTAAVVVLLEHDRRAHTPPLLAAPSKRTGGAKVTKAPSRNPIRLPTLSELRGQAVTPLEMPPIDDIAAHGSTCVFHADDQGIGAWGDDGGKWAHPVGWTSLVERFNQICSMHDPEDESANTHGWFDSVANGEYNMVFALSDGAQQALDLPQLVDRDGQQVPFSKVVFRLTRPDTGRQTNGAAFHRYKKLGNISRELYYSLHGAVNGYAPQCYAAILFPAILDTHKCGADQLYGTLYVMRRADLDLNTLMDTQADNTLKGGKVDPHSMEYVETLRRSGRSVAIKLLPVVFRQSMLGCLNFDSKPANYVFGYDKKPYAIDFDAAMYSLTNVGARGWEGHMLMNLMLLTAHVRAFRHPALADGWVACVRPLLIELCAHARGTRWLFEARVTNVGFKELHDDTDLTARKRLEMMISEYFVRASSKSVAPFRAALGEGAAPLVHQIMRYCLHGSIHRPDVELDRLLGKCSGAASQFGSETQRPSTSR